MIRANQYYWLNLFLSQGKRGAKLSFTKALEGKEGGEKKMIKKIAAIAGAGALLLSVAGPALAFGTQGGCRCFVPWNCACRDENTAVVTNNVSSGAYTGGNSQSTEAEVEHAYRSEAEVEGGSQLITTGDASSYAGALTVANVNFGCDNCGVSRPRTNRAQVGNTVNAMADTGLNEQEAEAEVEDAACSEAEVEDGGQTIRTGDASATSRSWTIVNSQWSWVR